MVQKILSEYFHKRGYNSENRSSDNDYSHEKANAAQNFPAELKVYPFGASINSNNIKDGSIQPLEKKPAKRSVFTKKQLVLLNQRLEMQKRISLY
jgi:hypothetical protein